MKVHPRERECGDDSGDSNLLQTDVAGELPSMLGEFHNIIDGHYGSWELGIGGHLIVATMGWLCRHFMAMNQIL